MKDKYIEYAKKTIKGKTLALVLNNIDLFYKKTIVINKNKNNVGEDAFLEKGTFIHSIRNGFDDFDWITKNGFISTDFS